MSGLLKIGTVFSGIGAIEQALKRLRIPYEISFACDNGNIDIFEKKINKNFSDISKAIDELIEYIKVNQIQYVKDNNQLNFNDQVEILLADSVELSRKQEEFYTDNIELIADVVRYLKENIDEKSVRYDKLLQMKMNDLDLATLEILMKPFKESSLNKIILDLKKSSNHKKIMSLYNSIIKDINTVYERIKTQELYENLSQLPNFEQKKAYIDNLYNDKGSKNFVQESYMANYDIDPNHFHQNIAFMDGNQYKNEIDLYVGGSPCQSFSMVGQRKGLEDTRGTLFYEYARVLKECQP